MGTDGLSSTVSRRADELFAAQKWPSVEEESWRRTDLAHILPGGVDFLEQYGRSRDADSGRTDAVAEEVGELPDGYAARVITSNGFPVSMKVSTEAQIKGLELDWVESRNLPASLTMLGERELDESPNRLMSWHWRDMQGAIVLRVPASVQIGGVIMIRESVPPGDGSVYLPHVHVEAASGAEVSVLWSLENADSSPVKDAGQAGEAMPLKGNTRRRPGKDSLLSAVPVSRRSLVNGGLSVIAEDNAGVKVALRQMMGSGAVCFIWNRLEAARDARIYLVESQLGAAVVKTLSRAVMSAKGSEVRLKGLYFVDDVNHKDIGTLQNHRAPGTVSDALYKGVIAGGGRSVFQGLIDVAGGASKTDSYLTNNNLILEDGARADSLPQLNILTDDVKCSHGSTTGRLDDVKQFYLQSRGYSPQEARAELIYGFLAEVIDFAPDLVAQVLGEDLDVVLKRMAR